MAGLNIERHELKLGLGDTSRTYMYMGYVSPKCRTQSHFIVRSFGTLILNNLRTRKPGSETICNVLLGGTSRTYLFIYLLKYFLLDWTITLPYSFLASS